jgi:Asp-tRNA(Asn)/Glu-tRNA(Gln) amidotransferase C subunit
MHDKWKLRELLSAGKEVQEISQELGCHYSTVYRAKQTWLDPPKVRKPGSGRKPTVTTPALIRSIDTKIKRNPNRSMRKMAREGNVSEFTVRKIVKNVLKAKSRAKLKRHLLTEKTRQTREEHCRKILSFFKNGNKLPILFSDEKIFTVDSVSNSRNDRFISTERIEDVPENVKFTYRTKHPASTMMFGLVSSDGKKMPPVFIPAGVKVNTDVYIGILQKHVLPWTKREYPDGEFIWQQDGAPCHTSKRSQEWLLENMKHMSG